MKTLEFNQMEIILGGASQRDCLVRGFGIVICATVGCFFAPAFGAALAIAGTSGDCY